MVKFAMLRRLTRYADRRTKTGLKQLACGCKTTRASSSDASVWDSLGQFPGGSVDLHKDEASGIATLALNQPDKRNALTGHMMRDLATAVKDLDGWQHGKGVILHGAGDVFCAGGDFSMVKNILNPEAGGRMCAFMQDVTYRLHSLPLISVALIQGSALGGGAELVTSCDFRLMTQKATIGFVQSTLDVSTGWGGGSRLVQLVGRTTALDLLATGRRVSAEEALKMGLVQRVIPEEDALEEAKTWIKSHTRAAAVVVHAVKGTVVAASSLSMGEALEEERKAFMSVWGGPAHTAAVLKAIAPRKK